MTARNVLDAAELLYDAAIAARECDEAMAKYNDITSDPKRTFDEMQAQLMVCQQAKVKALRLRDAALARAHAEPAGVGRVS